MCLCSLVYNSDLNVIFYLSSDLLVIANVRVLRRWYLARHLYFECELVWEKDRSILLAMVLLTMNTSQSIQASIKNPCREFSGIVVYSAHIECSLGVLRFLCFSWALFKWARLACLPDPYVCGLFVVLYWGARALLSVERVLFEYTVCCGGRARHPGLALFLCVWVSSYLCCGCDIGSLLTLFTITPHWSLIALLF